MRWRELVLPVAASAVVGAGLAVGGHAALLLALGAVLGVALLLREEVAFWVLLVVGATVLPYTGQTLSIGGATTSPTELLLFGLVGTWGLRHLLGRPSPDSPFALFALAVLVAVLISSMWATARGADGHTVFGLAKYWCYYLLILPAAGLFSTRAARARLATGIVWVTAVGTVLTLISVFAHVHLPFVGTRPLEVGTLGNTDLGVERVRPDLVALLVLATLLVAGDIAMKGATPRRVVLLGLFVLLHALSFTRSTWAPLLIALGALALLHAGPRRRFRMFRQGVVVLVLGAALIGLGAAGVFGETGHAAVRRVDSMVNPQVTHEASYTLRQDENRSARKAIAQHPLLGVGISSSYGHRVPTYEDNPPRFVYTDQLFLHNQYYYVWLQLGLLGFVALVLLWPLAGWCLLQGRRAPDRALGNVQVCAALSIAVYLAQFFLQTTVNYQANVIAFVCAMVLASPLPRAARNPLPAVAEREAVPVPA